MGSTHRARSRSHKAPGASRSGGTGRLPRGGLGGRGLQPHRSPDAYWKHTCTSIYAHECVHAHTHATCMCTHARVFEDIGTHAHTHSRTRAHAHITGKACPARQGCAQGSFTHLQRRHKLRRKAVVGVAQAQLAVLVPAERVEAPVVRHGERVGVPARHANNLQQRRQPARRNSSVPSQEARTPCLSLPVQGGLWAAPSRPVPGSGCAVPSWVLLAVRRSAGC
jgi:hypothetical protein